MERLALAFATSIVISPPVAAADSDFGTGNWLKRVCDSNNPYDQGLCSGVVVGATREYILLTGPKSDVPPACLPNEVEIGQFIGVVKNYMASHPENLHLWAENLVTRAVHDAWPCRGS
jgi:hypothetical protein